jgi:hypothetical protein
VQIGAEKGYSFDETEIRTLAKSDPRTSGGEELTDEQLEAVAGGSGSCLGTWEAPMSDNW